MESHAVLLIGYDDRREAFLIIDPWRNESDGSYRGERYLSYEDYCLLMVNGSAEKATVLSLPQIEMSPRCEGEEKFIDFEVGFFRPRGYVLDEEGTALTKLKFAISVGQSEVTRALEGKWRIGECARFSVPVPDGVEGVCGVQVLAQITLEGIRPYRYRDEFSCRVDQKIDLGRGKTLETDNSAREVVASA